jgi:putative membrane protein
MRKPKLESWFLLCLGLAALAVSGISPKDRLTWLMEALPVMVAIPTLAYLNLRNPLTPVLYRLMFLAACFILVGAHYTYAEVPLGFWVQDALGTSRNHYDRWGHALLGVVMAMLAREILIRYSPLKRGAWLFFSCVCFAVAVGACYEFAEWWAALVLGESDADAFLAMQGDEWDTQWDMFLAMAGAVAALLVFARVHDRQLEQSSPVHWRVKTPRPVFHSAIIRP